MYALIVLILSLRGVVDVSNGLTDNWYTRADMPTVRQNMAATVVSGKIYVIGGYNSKGYLQTNEMYDPATNKWITRADMPTARAWLAVASVNDKIYAIGGDTPSECVTTNEEYNPEKDSWTPKKGMSIARFGLAAAAAGGNIYAIGGYNYKKGILQTNEQYDPVSDKWTTRADMPTARYNLGAAALNGKVYAIGGYSSKYYWNKNEEYSPCKDSWVTKDSLTHYRCDLAVVADTFNGKIYAIGGSAGTPVNYNEEYDPEANDWTIKLPMPTTRERLVAACPLSGRIFAIGGRNTTGQLQTTEEYNPIPVGVEEGRNANHSLIQNIKIYPNPVAQLTTISYQLPAKSKILLKIYDISGRLVNTLVDETKGAGCYSINLNTEGIPNGVYFCKLEYNGEVLTQKLVLVK
ncbi:MAG: kelch repeat-containing protein [bacterium]|nr:kelch repeat-containing protein [bacterium]